ncbi:MAG: hypothetical protein ACEQSR_08930 [Candidatus Methylacidiphilales bacterium]
MKTTFLTIAFLTLVSSAILAKNPTKIEEQNGVTKNAATFSTKTMVATVKYDDANLLTLTLNKTSTEKVKLSITKNGITIFSDSYTSVQELNKGYDLSELPKGKYIIVITQGNQKFEKQIEKTFDGVLEIE